MSILRGGLCWAMLVIAPVSLLGQSGQDATPQSSTEQGKASSAILHTQGGVWVNGYEAQDSSAIFVGDLVETKPGFAATLTLDGTSVAIGEESVAKLEEDALVLDHGSVSVGTSKTFKVRVKCITVTPVHNEWTQYDVTDVTPTMQVAAHKDDVRVEFGSTGQKDAKQPEIPQAATLREGEQRKYLESEACGAPPRPTGASSGLSPKWIAVGAGGAGVLVWVLVHGGGGKTPLSASQP